MYNYPIYSISIHFGQREDGSGSEHTIDGQNFVAEVRLRTISYQSETNYTNNIIDPIIEFRSRTITLIKSEK